MNDLNEISEVAFLFSEGRSVRSLADQRRCSPSEVEEAIRYRLFDPRYIDRLADLLLGIHEQHYSDDIDHLTIVLLLLLAEKLDPEGYQVLRRTLKVDDVHSEGVMA